MTTAFVLSGGASLGAIQVGMLHANESWSGGPVSGGVPVVLALFPVVAQVPQSIAFFTIVFFAVLVSTLIQGVTVVPRARRLGVAEG